MAGLCAPLPTLRRHPHGCQRTARGRCGSLILHRSGLAPPTPCRFGRRTINQDLRNVLPAFGLVVGAEVRLAGGGSLLGTLFTGCVCADRAFWSPFSSANRSVSNPSSLAIHLE